MPEFSLSPVARQEVTDIWEYIAQDNPEAADKWIEAAFAAFRKLAQMPEMGKARDYENPKLHGLRYWVIPEFPRYLIFYFPTEQGVEISRVLHGARNIESLLGGESG